MPFPTVARVTHFLFCSLLVNQQANLQTEEAQRELAAWLLRAKLVSTIREPVVAYATMDLTKDQQQKVMVFERENVQRQIRLLRTIPDLENWQPDDKQQLESIRKTAIEFRDALIAVRDAAKRHERRKQTKGRANTGGPSQSRSSTLRDPPKRSDLDLHTARRNLRKLLDSSMNHFRTGCVGRAQSELEASLRDSWRGARQVLLLYINELIPRIMADGYVQAFETEGLLISAKRVKQTESGPAITLPGESTEPAMIRGVVYEVTDAFGSACTGVIALYHSKNRWKLSKTNEDNGGFYELRLRD